MKCIRYSCLLVLFLCAAVVAQPKLDDATRHLISEIDRDWNSTSRNRLAQLEVSCDGAIAALDGSIHKAQLSSLYLDCGIISKRLKNTERAIDLLKKSAATAKETSNLSRERVANVWLGDTLKENYRVAEAIQHYQVAVALANKIGNKLLIANDLGKLGRTFDLSGDVEKAIEYISQAAIINLERKDHDEVAADFHYIGFMLLDRNRLEEALKVFNTGLAAAKQGSNRSLTISYFRQIGETHLRLGNFDASLTAYNEAKYWGGVNPNPADAAVIAASISKVHRQAGNYAAAVAAATESIELAQKAGHDRILSTAYLSRGHVYMTMGDLPQAEAHYLLANLLARKAGDFARLIESFDVAALALSSSGEKAKVEELCAELIDLVTKHENLRNVEPAARRIAARAYKMVGRTDLQLNHLNRAIESAQKISNASEEIQARIELAAELIFTEKRTVGIEHLEKALELLKTTGSADQRASAYQKIGGAYMLDPQSRDKAGAAFLEALFIDASSGNRAGEAETLGYLMRLESMLQNPRLAIFYGKIFAARMQEMRRSGRSLSVETQKSLLAKSQEGYRFLIELLIDADRREEAVQFLNLLKDQEFYDGNDTYRRKWAIPFSNREESLMKEYDAVSKPNAASGTTPENVASKPRSKATSAGFQDVLRRVKSDLSSPVSNIDRPPPVPEIESWRRALTNVSKESGHSVAAVYTLIGANSFRHVIVTANGIEAVAQSLKGTEINAKAKQFWSLLQSDAYDPNPMGKELYDIVFKPIEAKLPPNTKTILWSLDGNLRYVPVAALFDGKQYLVERFSNVNFTRADFDAMASPTRPNWTAAAFGTSKAHTVSLFGNSIGFSPLPGVVDEIEGIFGTAGDNKVLTGQVILDEKFDRRSLTARAKASTPLVHVASHFSFRPGDDARSFLLLGDGTPLTLAEMKSEKDLFAGVELLTLSACNTAAQQSDTNGREVDAFFELAQRLGAKSVLATLWPVADSSTPWLMREFYDTKIRRNQSKAEALRIAQLALLNGSAKMETLADRPAKVAVSERIEPGKEMPATRADEFVTEKKDAAPFRRDPERPFAHPFYWSPFVLVGNWR